jgi:dTDP-4-amino-4,6-dideoxygalactose transaminase
VVRSPDRDQVAAELAAAGIETQVHYRRPLHGRSPGPAESFLVAERWAQKVRSLPLHSALTDAEQDAVNEALAESLR